MKKEPNLYVFLGAGGVGKTTLSAAYALALAESGRKVGLLSIDPAKRLQDALGVGTLTDQGSLIPIENKNGELRASVLNPLQCLERWIAQKGMDEQKRTQLFANPYFHALTEKITSSSDSLAAIRVAEWVEQYPDLDALVVDTAPGIHAVDFIAKPEKLLSFLDGKFIELLKSLTAESENKKSPFFARLLKSGAKKILDGLVAVSGKTFLVGFGEFLTLIDGLFLTAVERVTYTKNWFLKKSCEVILVCGVREDSAHLAEQFVQILHKMNILPTACVLNRSFPATLQNERKFLDFMNAKTHSHISADLFTNFLSSYNETEMRVFHILEKFTQLIIKMPLNAGLDKETALRMRDLVALGSYLMQQRSDNFSSERRG